MYFYLWCICYICIIIYIYIRYKSHFVAFTGLSFMCPSNPLASSSHVLTYYFHTGRAFQVVGIFHSHRVCSSISIICIVDGQGPHQANDTRHNPARFLHHDLAVLPPDHISLFVQFTTQVQRLPLDHCDFLFQGFHETNRKFCGEFQANTFKVFSERKLRGFVWNHNEWYHWGLCCKI